MAALIAALVLTACGSAAGQRSAGPASRSPTRPNATPASTPAPSPTALIPRGRASVHVPILTYHYVGQVPANDPNPRLRGGLTVSPQAFLQQVQWLIANGYHTIDAQQLDTYLEGQADLPAKPVMLTIDDGNADLYTAAFPILRQYHLTAVAYIVSGFLGAAGHVTASQVLEMSQNGIQIGSHTFNHEDLTQEPPSRLQMELIRPKQTLEQLTGRPVTDFAYPAGRYDRAVQAAVQQAGYVSAMATDVGSAPAAPSGSGTARTWSGRFAWSRDEVNGRESLDQFASSLGPSDPAVSGQATPA